MKREKFSQEIERRIAQTYKGSVFTPADFKDLANMQTIKKCLSRLVAAGRIVRVMRGVYEVPDFSELMMEPVAVDPEKVAESIARAHGWTIAPSGDTARNLLGLSTQVPNSWTFLSDGPYKTYAWNDVQVEFKHRTHREITSLSPKSALIVQALKSIGKAKVDEDIVRRLALVVRSDEKATMLEETLHASAWIYEVIKRICKEGY